MCIVLLQHFNIRRVYKGLLKLLDANSAKKEQESTSNAKKSRKPRPISKLVTHIALGNEIKIQGNLRIIKSMHSFHA